MKRSIEKTISRANESAAGLQPFLDNTGLQDIAHAMTELLSLARGMTVLKKELAQYAEIPSPLGFDIQKLLLALRASLERVSIMFGDTRFVKVNGQLPYRQLWYDMNQEMREKGPPLDARLEFFSVFLNEIISALQGYELANSEITDT
jgi:hypothetical protein